MDNFDVNLGRRIREYRKERNFKQEIVANALGLPRTSISQIETGDRKVSAEELCKLSKILGVPIAVLTDVTDDLDQAIARVLTSIPAQEDFLPWYWLEECVSKEGEKHRVSYRTVEARPVEDRLPLELLPPPGSLLHKNDSGDWYCKNAEQQNITMQIVNTIFEDTHYKSRAISQFLAIAQAKLFASFHKSPLISESPIHNWFALSYAQYLTIPRSVLQSMPVKWQGRFVNCLNELDRLIDWRPSEGCYRVTLNLENDDDDGDKWWGQEIDDPLADYQRGRRRLSLNVRN